jgi:hypothetical protein
MKDDINVTPRNHRKARIIMKWLLGRSVQDNMAR